MKKEAMTLNLFLKVTIRMKTKLPVTKIVPKIRDATIKISEKRL
jgi:hypothetical protein